jgi:UDP-N-acetylglucosamine 4,6-dehydratase/UDP-glucose 4-epimerase
MVIKDKIFVVTGGYGFLASYLIDDIIKRGGYVRTIGRDFSKLKKLEKKYGNKIKIFCGDIYYNSDVQDLITEEVTGVFHLASFKYVGEAEKKTIECVTTNVIGTMNVLEVSTLSNVKFVMGVTGAAAVQVSGTYGATKMLNEKLFFNYQKLYPKTKFRILRYGNILYSTSSVTCKWKEAILKGNPLTITKGNPTRFFSTVNEAVDLIYDCIDYSVDFEPYVPELKATDMHTLLNAMIRKYGSSDKPIEIKTINIGEGENMHEKLEKNGLSSKISEQFFFDELLMKI